MSCLCVKKHSAALHSETCVYVLNYIADFDNHTKPYKFGFISINCAALTRVTVTRSVNYSLKSVNYCVSVFLCELVGKKAPMTSHMTLDFSIAFHRHRSDLVDWGCFLGTHPKALVAARALICGVLKLWLVDCTYRKDDNRVCHHCHHRRALCCPRLRRV